MPQNEDTPNTPATVNPQVLDAIKEASFGAFGRFDNASSGKLDVGVEIARLKVAQATSLAIQDATDYQRNMMAIMTAVQSKAFTMMFTDPTQATVYQTISNQALEVMTKTAAFYANACSNAGAALEKYPSG